MITLALTDKGLESEIREKMARRLHSLERKVIPTGKPTFPELPFGPTVARKNMASLVGHESWHLFDLLELNGSQDWLLSPTSTWDVNPAYKVLENFTRDLTVVNDLAERGIHLATDFINRVQSEEQRDALFQTVEFFRSIVKNSSKLSKKSFKLC